MTRGKGLKRVIVAKGFYQCCKDMLNINGSIARWVKTVGRSEACGTESMNVRHEAGRHHGDRQRGKLPSATQLASIVHRQT